MTSNKKMIISGFLIASFVQLFRRQSVLNSPPKQQPYIEVTTGMNQIQPAPPTFSPFASQQMAPGFPHLVAPVPGSAWKCPDWMTQGPHNGFTFNAQKDYRMPFKRKATPDMDL